MIEICGRTHIGQRPLNEDRFVADSNWGIALVSDGMGGPAAGEVAAGIVTSSVVDLLDQGLPLGEAVVRAHEEVQKAAGDGRGKSGMGATLVAAHFDGHDFELAWIGDSRAYLWNGELRQLTRDHSHVENLLANGDISLEESEQRSDRHLITRAMGLGDLQVADVPVIGGTLCRGQQLLLCSDGLNDVLSGTELATVMAAPMDGAGKLDELVGRAVKAGGKDNITAVMVTAGDDAPAPESVTPLPAVSVARVDGYTRYYRPGDSENGGD